MNRYSTMVQWNDITRLRKYVTVINQNETNSLINTLKKPQIAHYTTSFMIGMSYFKQKQYQKAIIWLARAYYINQIGPHRYYPLVVYRYVTSFRHILLTKSPLHEEVLYHLALSYHNLNEDHYSLKFLHLLEGNLSPALLERYLSLKADVYSGKQFTKAQAIYRKLVRTFSKPSHYIRMGFFYEKHNKNIKALRYYLKVLNFIHNKWTYKLATKEIYKLLKQYSYLKKYLSNDDWAFYVEGLRIIAKTHKASNYITRIKTNKLKQKHSRLLYLKTNSLLMFRKRQIQKGTTYIKRHITQLNEENQVLLRYYASNYLLKKKRYKQVLNIIPTFSKNRRNMLIRVRALYHIKHRNRDSGASYYLSHFDADSVIAERCFFSKCFEYILGHKIQNARSCLSRLTQVTKNVPVGGRSRYFLAKMYEKNNLQKSIQNYKEVYLNSPSDYYVFKALKKVKAKHDSLPIENNITNIRQWIANNISSPRSKKDFFHYKAQHPGYAVDPFWKKWEEKLTDIIKQADNKSRKALLLIAMRHKNIAQHYFLKNTDLMERNLYYQQAGHLIQDPYLKFTYLQHYLVKHKYNIDIFTLSEKARKTLYPTPYLKYVERATQKLNLKKSHIYALMKQESNFNPGAVSSVGATGLMQVMPSTSRDVNKKLKIRSLNLKNPEHSIRLGAKFFSYIKNHNVNIFEEIATAYNAGPSRLRRWKNTIFKKHPPDIAFEKIPFRETKVYVKRTGRYYDRYKILLQYP